MGIFLFAVIIPIVFEGIGRLGILTGVPWLNNLSFMTNEYARLFFALIMVFVILYSRLGFRDLHQAEENLETLNRELERKVKEKTRDLSLLLDATIKTSQTLDLKEILRVFSETLIRSFSCHTFCRAAIIDNIKKTFEIKIVASIRPLDIKPLVGKVFPLNNFKFLTKAINSLDIKTIGIDSNVLSEKEKKFIFQDQFRTALIIPFFQGRRVLGFALLCEARSPERSRFSRGNIEFYKTLSNHLSISIHNALLFSKNKSIFLHTIQALAAAVDARDSYTLFHSRNVTEYTVKIATAMNIPAYQIAVLRVAGLLHDIGKIGIKDEILLKPGKLTGEEFEEIKTHPLKAVKILKAVDELKDVSKIIAAHHERYEGNGYPHGLQGEQIPLGARIITVADAYDAMTSSRVYHNPLSKEKTTEIIKKCSGTQFDPQVVNAFLKIAPTLSPVNKLDRQGQ